VLGIQARAQRVAEHQILIGPHIGNGHALGELARPVRAQAVSGIGFLGAGMILLRKNVICGLTTAASIWAVAAIAQLPDAELVSLADIAAEAGPRRFRFPVARGPPYACHSTARFIARCWPSYEPERAPSQEA
jgi:hypothetical protein